MNGTIRLATVGYRLPVEDLPQVDIHPAIVAALQRRIDSYWKATLYRASSLVPERRPSQWCKIRLGVT